MIRKWRRWRGYLRQYKEGGLILIWKIGCCGKRLKDENFSVKCLYSALDSRSAVQFPKSIIWSPCVPTKASFFAWEAS